MRLALAHPTAGYYAAPRSTVFGRGGDFITAPELSQMMGELVAVWFAAVWQQRWAAATSPPLLHVIECGPGRGVLAADALRTWRRLPQFADRIVGLTLVETSPAMRTAQAATLRVDSVPDADVAAPFLAHASGVVRSFRPGPSPAGGSADLPVRWVDRLEDAFSPPLPPAPSSPPRVLPLIIANELFDALPTHQFVWTAAGWRERLVDIAADAAAAADSDEDVRLRFVLAPTATPASLAYTAWRTERVARDVSGEPTSAAMRALAAGSRRLGSSPLNRQPALGDVAEWSPQSVQLAASMARQLVGAGGGAALLIDYGHADVFTQRDGAATVRGIRGHSVVDVLSSPGLVDVSADVDFGTLLHAAASVVSVPLPGQAQSAGLDGPPTRASWWRADGPITQGEFLSRMGIGARLDRLLRGATGQ